MTVHGAALQLAARRRALRQVFAPGWALLACLLVLVQAPAGLRAPVVIVFFCFVPGTALVGLINPDSFGVELSLTVALSVAVSGLTGGILVYADLGSPTAVVLIVTVVSLVAGLRDERLRDRGRAQLQGLQLRTLVAGRRRIGPRGLPAAVLQPAEVVSQEASSVSDRIAAVSEPAGRARRKVTPELWFVDDFEQRNRSQAPDEPRSHTATAPRGVLITGVSARTSIPVAWRVLEGEGKKEWRTRLALEMIDALQGPDLRETVVAADTGFGSLSGFRRGLTARGLSYLLRVSPVTAAREFAPDGPSRSAAEAREILEERMGAQPRSRAGRDGSELVVLEGAEQILICEVPSAGGDSVFWLSNLPVWTAPERLASLVRSANRRRVEGAANDLFKVAEGMAAEEDAELGRERASFNGSTTTTDADQ